VLEGYFEVKLESYKIKLSALTGYLYGHKYGILIEVLSEI